MFVIGMCNFLNMFKFCLVLFKFIIWGVVMVIFVLSGIVWVSVSCVLFVFGGIFIISIFKFF